MLIGLRNRRTNELVFKDMLDVDFDMSVEEKDNKFYVKVNRNYRLPDEYLNRKDAEERMCYIASCRNNLEEDLKEY